MDTDPIIRNWVLDYLLRQPFEDWILDSLLHSLHLPTDQPNLKKTFLLKKLESGILRHSVSESTLDLLEQLEGIEFQLGNEAVSDAIKLAYCAVAVDFTVNILRDGGRGIKDKKFEFFEAVKRVWRERIGGMKEAVEKGGLVTQQLWEWKDEIEAAVWDDNVAESIVKNCEGVNGVEAVNAYIREERDKMGPSFLELVAETMKNDKNLQQIFGVDGGEQVAEKEAPSNDVDENNANKVGNATPTCDVFSYAVETDPLQDALKVAEAISREARNDDHQNPADKHAKSNSFVVDNAGVVRDPCAGAAQATDGNTSNVPKPSLKERNISAHTYEWEDSIEASQEDPAGQSMCQLPTPKRINTSPSDRHKVKKRRKPRKWSLLEEDTLRAEVEKYGKGNWKLILTANQDTFEGRTDVDLKDKWRNMTRY